MQGQGVGSDLGRRFGLARVSRLLFERSRSGLGSLKGSTGLL